MTTEEPEIIEEAPKRDFYYAFTDEAAAAEALQPFYHQPQVQSVDPETGEKLFDAETGEPVMEDDGDAYLVTGSADHAFDIIGLIHKATGNMLTDDEGMEYLRWLQFPAGISTCVSVATTCEPRPKPLMLSMV